MKVGTEAAQANQKFPPNWSDLTPEYLLAVHAAALNSANETRARFSNWPEATQ